jgi:hypothetical protein
MCDTAIIAMSHQEGRLVSYLEVYLSDLEQRLREWRLTINVSKSIEIFYSKLADVGSRYLGNSADTYADLRLTQVYQESLRRPG